ncbi:MAG TPA: divalent metal cation transporter [Nitrososphaeraceae archaeon]|nr:divalent metal cation transporter [Nitrososphaeraceae archaeon]
MTTNNSRKGRREQDDDKKDIMRYDKKVSKKASPFLNKKSLGILGPGVITGASDDDPSGIATYSQAGAQFGFGMLWLALFQYPLMMVVQETCARIGLVTGSGLAAIIKQKYSRKVIFPLATLLLIANTINIGADIGAMAASVRLVYPQLPVIVATLSFTAFIIMSEIFVPYGKYVKILKYLTIFLFAYVATAIIVGGNGYQILIATIIPHIEFTPAFAMMIVAIFGTTISPYLFFWQASEEAEEDVAKHKIKDIGKGKPKIAKKDIKLMRQDTAIGMAFSQIIMWSIITTAAGSLHTHGVTDIQSAAQAAKALEPLVKTFPQAGEISKTIFALGIIGTGLLAIPVLAGSSGYALSDVIGWPEGLNKQFKEAKGFYFIISASTLIGLWINFTNIDPIKALVYTAVINGIIAVPILFAVMKIANDKIILRNKTNSKISNIVGWLTFAIMGISVVIMFVTLGK